MSLVVFTGGARSGKSSAASLLADARRNVSQPVVYAVFGISQNDEEFAVRVSAHRESRPVNTETLEAAADPFAIFEVPDHSLLVIDCLGTALGAVMLAELERVGVALEAAPLDSLPSGLTGSVQERFDRFTASIIDRRGDTIVVTNEVGDGVIPIYASGRLFRDVLGRSNRMLVDASDSAYLCVAGRLIDLSRLSHSALWPED